MRLSTAKDKIIRAAVKGHAEIAEIKKTFDRHTFSAAVKSLADEKYIEAIATAAAGAGHIRTYEVGAVNPIAAQFVQSGQSFRRKAFWEWVANLPKYIWFLTAILGFIAGKIWDKQTEKTETDKPPKTEQLPKEKESYPKSRVPDTTVVVDTSSN
jgi:hypothetical protein